MEGLLNLRVQPGISLQPPGDVVSAEVTDRSLPGVMRVLDQLGLTTTAGNSVTTSEITSMQSTSSAQAITRDASISSWEEMEGNLARESNMSSNLLGVMFLAGVTATVGIATNALHLVIGAMVVAPGFGPIIRVALGLVSQSGAWQRGLIDTLRGYLALLAGAVVAAAVLRLLNVDLLPGQASYVPRGALAEYWTTINFTTVVVTSAASLLGAVLIAANRTILTVGVMIALALVPAMSIVGMGLVAGQFGVAASGLVRWLFDTSFILVFAALVFAWKQARLYQRTMKL